MHGMKCVKYNAKLRANANFCYKCSLQVSCKKCLAKLYSEANFCYKCGAAIKSESSSINQTTKNVENIHLKNLVDNEKHNFESRLAQQIESHQTVRSNVIYKSNKNNKKNIIKNIIYKGALVKLLRVNSQCTKEAKIKNSKTLKTRFNIEDSIDEILNSLIELFKNGEKNNATEIASSISNKIESKNLKSSGKLFNDPNLNIFKKDTNLNINLNTNPNISNVPNKVVEYTYISSDNDIEQFLSEKTIKQEQSVINDNNFNNQKNNSQDDLPEENKALAKALNKTLRDISTKPSLFFQVHYLNELGSNIPQVFIDKKNKYLVEEYDIVNKTFKYIRSIYIEIEEEPFASGGFCKAFKSQIIKNGTNNIFFESSNILVVKQYLR
ncbi:hypothetical protein F8M41_002017 [Gigaspora margarita]|uniref:Uncharacterized protein n=1 Tax=Gigaspora margarita TaxID=4874 RepID=A0A8H4AYV0_GIGMA|nr:hypothetical protein F8M41_002017 [Gigaspora margarita]